MDVTRRGLLKGMALGLGGLMMPWGEILAAPTPLGEPEGYSLESYNRLMGADPGELDLALTGNLIEGEIPSALIGGRFLSNGPARLKREGRLAHPFDGHGYVRSLRLDSSNSASLKSRFVRTTAFEAEEAAQALVYKGLGTLPYDPAHGGARKNRKAPGDRNVANTTLYTWGDKLLAGWEGGKPHLMDLDTLGTLGMEDFGGALGDVPFLAHVRVDEASGRMVGITQKLGKDTELTFLEFDKAGAQVAKRTYLHPGAMFLHDFLITPNYYILTDNPLKIDIGTFIKAMRGKATLIGALSADISRPGRVILIPRRGGEARSIELDQSLFTVHYGNAWEEGDSLRLFSCGFEDLTFGHEFGYQGATSPLNPSVTETETPQRLHEVVINLNTYNATVTRRSVHALDFPRVHPGRDGIKTNLMVSAARADITRRDPFDSLAVTQLLDPEAPIEIWTPGRGRFVGEPLFAPTPGSLEDGEGHILVLVYDPQNVRTDLCIFEPTNIAKGPVASVQIPELLPYGFHGAWVSA